MTDTDGLGNGSLDADHSITRSLYSGITSGERIARRPQTFVGPVRLPNRRIERDERKRVNGDVSHWIP